MEVLLIKERPILFSPEMAKALDLDQKSMTRRVVRPQPLDLDEPWPDDDSHVTFSDLLEDQAYYFSEVGYCPYGKIGDNLWVRESFRVVGWQEDFSRALVEYQGDNRKLWKALPETVNKAGKNLQVLGLKAYVLKSLSILKPTHYDNNGRGYFVIEKEGKAAGSWRSSLYMPRWASRTTLNLQAIKIEKLQELSSQDAILEGVYTSAHRREGLDYQEVFKEVWDSLHPDANRWEDNPYVFSLGFSVVKGA